MKPQLAALVVGIVGLAGCASEPPQTPERILYMALGASDAAGVGAEPITRGYVFRIADELDRSVDEVILANLGVPGADTGRLDDALELFLKSGARPDLMTVWTGANDVIEGEDVDDFEDALASILDRLRDRTDGVIAIANLPDLTQLPRFREDPDEDVTEDRIDDFNDAIEEQAEDHDALIVDLHAEPVVDDLVSDRDGFHPNNAGHEQIADHFLGVIMPALGLAPVS